MSRSAPPKPPPDTSSERNQYIPSFIAAKPFYASSLPDSDYLLHQRSKAVPTDTLDKAKWYDSRGKTTGPAATKYRKGACENCGSMSHKSKECLERKRKVGARWTGRDIRGDEVVEDVRLGWDAKRDRWNGYDAAAYDEVVESYTEQEGTKDAGETPTNNGQDNDDSNAIPSTNEGEAQDDARIEEEDPLLRLQPTSTRQLRLREDTAKYLLNLDIDSAKYDPKTRSMDTTLPSTNHVSNQNGGEDVDVDVSDGFIRPSESAAFERAQKYAWETQESTSIPANERVHLQANPTEGAVLLKRKEKADEEAREKKRKYLADHYGDATERAGREKVAKVGALSSSERYVEYDSSGKVKGLLKDETIPRSKYSEDVYQNNHSSVWGSWWRKGSWGYSCCRSTVKGSWCIGEEGRRAWQEEEMGRTGRGLIEDGRAEEDEDEERDERGREDGGTQRHAKARETDGKDNESKNKTLGEENRHSIERGATDEEMERYKRSKTSADDLMNAMPGKE